MGPKSRRQRHAITTSTRYLLNRSGNNAEDDAEREEMEVDDIEYEQQPMNFTDRITSDNIADLFELCKYKCPVKYLSVLIYATLRSFGHSWENCDTFLRTIGALKAQTAHRWADVFLKGDVEEFQGENRGGKHMAEFYDYFPDLEDAAREFTIRRCSEKAADFTAIDLANFIDKEYYLTTNTSKVNIPANATWKQNGVTIAGGHVQGGATNQLSYPQGLFIDDDQTVVIADYWNHRIMQWKNGDTTNGQVVAGDKDPGNELHQFRYPTDVLIDKETDSLIICDWRNRRVVRWSRRSGTTQVRRYQLGEKNGTLVAGGNGKGDGLNQLNRPAYLFVDRDHSVYVSDNENHRVMKWVEGAKEGIVVAGGHGKGNALTQLSSPSGIFVDTLGTLYVVDQGNHRVMRWTQGDKKQGTVIVGGNGYGVGANQFSAPYGLSFDRYGNLYVVDQNNHRVQRFFIE
ncbi:unnamed protein product [Rotaria socialis]|uniref:Uncharacterized protein n=1 Tax=Rotaria socialis TaxID=392032 RepID=A0A818EQN1_9BILA|nr:unnamed protein product [Rotaria socialis]